jgi:hypothetical protein
MEIKRIESVEIVYICEKCHTEYKDEHRCLSCENSHEDFAIGDNVNFTEEYEYYFGHDRYPSNGVSTISGVIVSVRLIGKNKEHLIEYGDGNRKWVSEKNLTGV